MNIPEHDVPAAAAERLVRLRHAPLNAVVRRQSLFVAGRRARNERAPVRRHHHAVHAPAIHHAVRALHNHALPPRKPRPRQHAAEKAGGVLVVQIVAVLDHAVLNPAHLRVGRGIVVRVQRDGIVERAEHGVPDHEFPPAPKMHAVLAPLNPQILKPRVFKRAHLHAEALRRQILHHVALHHQIADKAERQLRAESGDHLFLPLPRGIGAHAAGRQMQPANFNLLVPLARVRAAVDKQIRRLPVRRFMPAHLAARAEHEPRASF